jgi:hypothetical protein
MNLMLSLEQFNNEYIYFSDPTINNIMNNASFYRILYSTDLFISNGLYFYMYINHNSIEKYYNKYKCVFDVYNYTYYIDKIKTIESSILDKIKIKNKQCVLKIYEQMKSGIIKLFSEKNNEIHNNNVIIIKIAGIWESETQYGLTYKFIKL